MIVVLLPGEDRRLLGVSSRTRNERVVRRAGAKLVTLDELGNCGDEPALVIWPGTLINLDLFSMQPVREPTWILGDGGAAAVLAGSAHELNSSVVHLSTLHRPPGSGDPLPRRQAPTATVFDVSTPATARHAAWCVLQRSGKATDGWVSRNCSRPISRIISMAMLKLRLKANHASVMTLCVGLGAAALALQPGYLPLVGTGVLFQLASVLDGVDGEMARATLTETATGAVLDTVVDQVTYVACFIGVTIGWIREGAGLLALVWTGSIGVALVLSLMRGSKFVSRHAPNASFVFIDRAVRRAARDSGRAVLRISAALFTLLRRDAFAAIFFFVALAGYRSLVPLFVAFGVVLANLTFSRYQQELVAAAIAERFRT